MGRPRDTDNEIDGVTIRLLEWCGKYLPPLGINLDELKAAGGDVEEYKKLRAWHERYHDDAFPGETEMIRRPYGSNASVD